MSDFDNTNRFALFNQAERYAEKFADRDTSNWPAYSGTIDVEGVEYEISAWVKESKGGKKYMSGSIKLKEEYNTTKKDTETVVKVDVKEDDLPF